MSIENLTGSNFNDNLHIEFVDNSTVNGGNGNDSLAIGHSIGGMLNGGAGDDELFFGNGTGTLNGGTGNDRLTAGDGGVLNGGDGNDVLMVSGAAFVSSTLTGGAGADTLYGVEHLSMTFDYNAVSDSPAGAGRDVIHHFNEFFDSDRIDLSTIDANTLVAGNQAFILGGSFTAGHLRYVGGVLQGNTDADMAAEFEIQLIATPPLVVGGAGTDIPPVRLRNLMKGVPIRGRPS